MMKHLDTMKIRRAHTDSQFLAVELVKRIIVNFGLKEKNRVREIVDIRRCIYHYLKVTHKLSYIEISEIFECDHATVIHHVKQYEYLKKDVDFLENTKLIREMLEREQGHVKRFNVTIEIEFSARSENEAKEYAERVAGIYSGKLTNLKEV